MTPPHRTLIGKVTGGVTRQRVYRIDDGLEMDDIDHFEVTRKRVFFDDVVAITLHKERGWLVLSILGFLTLLFGGIAVLVWSEPAAAGTLMFIAACFAVPLLLRWFLQVDVITVVGRRTRVRMKFAYRKGHAAELFLTLSLDIRKAQRLAAERNARETRAATDASLPQPPQEPAPAPQLPDSEAWPAWTPDEPKE